MLEIQAQIVDDSTELVYGPHSTSFTTEFNLLNNLDAYQNVDTSIYLFERQSFLDLNARRFQSLGNFGTPLFPVFFTPPQTIGRTSGFNAYQFYAFSPSDVKYYDTKSPFIDMLVYLGGGNRNLVNIGFSRNINENWNIGFDLRTITTNKQLAPQNQTDRLVVGTSFVAYSHYKHKKLPYQAAINYSSMSHKVVEQGGARPTSDSLRTDFFLFDNVLLRLDDATSVTRTTNWHFYHDFQIADQFQLYHKLDYRNETNTFEDESGGTGPGGYDPYADFYNDFLIDEDETQERNEFTSFSNEVGLKGDLSNVFYRFYAKTRSIQWNYLLYDPNENQVETYLGGFARFRWKDKFAVTGDAEYLLGGQYQLGGKLSSDILNVSYRTMSYAVPFIYRDYFGNHHEWHNDFRPIFTNQLEGQINLDFKSFEIRSKLTATSHSNFVYLDRNINPVQSTDVFITSIGGDFNLRILNDKGEGWNLENEVILTNVSGGAASAVRIPDAFINARYFWSGKWFSDLIPVEVGIDVHSRSAYFANAFAPEIQQFYLQDEQEVFGYAAADLFINMQVDKFRFALKWTHANQARNDGYIVSPNYPGQPRAIDLIVKWMFFD